MKKNKWLIIIGLIIFCVCLPVQAKQKEMTVNILNKDGCQTIHSRTNQYKYTISCYFGVVDAKQYNTIHLDGEKGGFVASSVNFISSYCNECFSGDGVFQSQKTINIDQSKVKEQCLNKECNANINFKSQNIKLLDINTSEYYTYHIVFEITYIEQEQPPTPIDPVNPVNPDNPDNPDNPTCEGIFSENLINFLVEILDYVKIIVPLLILVLGSVDLLRNVFAGKDEDIKKGWNRLFKRFIYGLLVYVLIYIVSILFPIANKLIGGCFEFFK